MLTRISTDSTCDLSAGFVARMGIAITPLSITVDDEVFRDGVDITPSDLFSYVEAGKSCRTGAVNIYEYQKHFQDLTASGDEVVHISLGSAFSSCYNNALLAARDFRSTGSGFQKPVHWERPLGSRGSPLSGGG